MKNLEPLEQQSNYDCGVASAAMIINYFTGKKPVWSKLVKYLGTTPAIGTRPNALARGLEKYSSKLHCNLTARTAWSELKEWNADPNIMVILDFWDLDEGHYVVMVDVSDQYIVVADPSTGRHRLISRETFETNWFDYEDDYEFNVRLSIVCYNSKVW